MIISNDSFRYFVAVFLGAMLSFFIYLFIEWFKNKNALKSWLISLTIEVSQNYELKKREVKEIKLKFSGIPRDLDIFEVYRNNFDIFYAFLKSGHSFKNNKILFKYSEYINNENRHIVFRKKWFKEHVEPNIIRARGLVSTSADFPHRDLVLKRDLEQLELIEEILFLLNRVTKTKYIKKDEKNND